MPVQKTANQRQGVNLCVVMLRFVVAKMNSEWRASRSFASSRSASHTTRRPLLHGRNF